MLKNLSIIIFISISLLSCSIVDKPVKRNLHVNPDTTNYYKIVSELPDPDQVYYMRGFIIFRYNTKKGYVLYHFNKRTMQLVRVRHYDTKL